MAGKKALIALALTLSAALAAPAAAQQSSIQRNGPYIEVWDNRGGNVLEMVRTREQLAASGREVRIRGYCRSACTILTTMPNACLGPNARIGFHAPRIQGTQIIPPYVDQIMGNFYRNGIRDRWFGGWNRRMEMQVISAQDYVRLDPETRICDSLRTHEQRTRRY
ncbi:hypothetical protein D3P06_15400 [Paracoccus aestuarii]|uniref:Uncharacterized protein n=1 Tax=Paracoccus aestuarii TaxID=453842 RepID=A0A418ZR00_9RHOB|nr:hypothetical protein D3P06_15400 [Paracoccus aestuarii]WCR00583.1 hypothetical protein JHW48_01160 [Paracoccus aestuarii]